MTVTIYRNTIAQAIVPLDENTVFTHKLMGEHKTVVDTIVAAPLVIQIGDYIEHKGERFYINTPPQVEKINNFTYSYIINFEGEVYTLFNKLFMDEGQADFSYHGSPNDLLLLLLDNINSIDAGWTIATVDNAPEQLLSFSGDTCRSALTKIAEAFGMEYRLAGKNIYLQKSVGSPTTLTFEYGRGKGLYSLTRNSIDDKSLVTRVFGFGARKNLDIDYRTGATRLVFEERKLEANTGLYGIREASVTFDDIFPQRTGTVTGVDGSDRNKIVDSSLDFDVNDQLIEGTVAKIVFKTGALAGYEFEINRYLNSSKTIEFNTFTEENGYQLPNALNYPEVGDEYTLVDISMPQTYIDAAELELKTRTQEYLEENSAPRVTYALNLDDKYVRDNGIELNIGNLIQIIDTDLGVNASIRVSEVSYPFVSPSTISAVISDTIPYTIQERLIADTVDNKTIIVNVDRRRAELARQATARFRQLQDLIFDPDGYFDPGNIKPSSIETLMLSVGARSQNFGLLGVSIQPNYGGNPNSLHISGGQLAHYEIEIDGLGYVWNISPQTFGTLVSGNNYYVYARCSKTALTGTWHISTTPKKTEDEAGQYLFNLGVLYNVANGRRDFDLTKGMTFINGDTITTGTIKSLDGESYFNLSEGKFRTGDTNSSLDWNVTTPNRLTIKGSILQTSSGSTINLPNYRGGYNPSTPYFKGDTVTYNGVAYSNKTDTATVGIAPPNATHWELFVDKGADGPPGADGQTLYTWVKYADDVNGNGISDSPTGKEYIGFAYNKTTPIESNDRILYQWSLLQGGQGVPGAPGADGQTYYTWIKYSNFPDGTDLYDTPNTNTLYIGIAVNKTTPTESTSKTQYTWSKFKGDQGVPGPAGANGADGSTGPSLLYRGDFSSSKLYYNTPTRRDAVKYGENYYLFKGSNATSGAWTLSNWDFFGAQFDSVATNLLLAESASIADWTINGGKITSQASYGSSPRTQLDGANGIITLVSPRTIYTATGASYIVEETIKIDSSNGHIVASHPGNGTQQAGFTELASDGLRSEFAGQAINNGIKQIRAGMLADVTGRLNASAFGNLGAVVGVYGRAQNVQSGGAPSFGGYFEQLFATAFHGLTAVVFSNGFTITQHVFIICKNSVATTIYLPTNPHEGRMCIVKRTTNDITVQGNGNNLYHDGPKGTSVTIDRNGEAFMFIYDGTEWQIIILDHA